MPAPRSNPENHCLALVRRDIICHIQAAITGHDLVIHTAGPFQRTSNHKVLEQAIACKVPYMDVCDDLPYSEE